MIFSVFQKNWVFGYSWSTLLWYRCYYPHRSRELVSPVCGIFCHIMGGVRFFRPLVGGSNGVVGEKEKFRVVCYDKRHLKPLGPEKNWISRPPPNISLKKKYKAQKGLQAFLTKHTSLIMFFQKKTYCIKATKLTKTVQRYKYQYQ